MSVYLSVCLYVSVDSTALHLIMGLGSWEVQPELFAFVCKSICIVPLCLSVCLSIFLFSCLSVCLSVCECGEYRATSHHGTG